VSGQIGLSANRAASPGSRGARSEVAVRHGIGWLFAAALVPGIVAASFLFYEIYRTERHQLEQGALQTARALSTGLERDLAAMRGKLEILATSSALQAGDLKTFYDQARNVLATEPLAEAIVLIDESGQQIVNTLRPYGSALPKSGHPEMVRRTFETGRPVVSDLYIGGVAQRPFVAVEVPVYRDGKVAYALDIGISAERLNRLLVEQHLPEGWIGNILDSQRTVVARTHNPASAVGRKATPDLMAAMARSAEGTLASHTLEGVPSFVAFSRSSLSNWTIAVAMTRDVLFANRFLPLTLAGLTIVAFVLAGAILAWLFSRGVRESLASLEMVTQAATHGDLDVTASPTGPREIARLAERFNKMQEARKDAEARLRLSASVFSSANEGIIVADRDRRIIEVNAAFTEITGYARDDVIGKNPRILQSGRQTAEFYEAMWRSLDAEGRWQGELWDQRKDGTPFAAHMTLGTVRDSSGAVTHYVALFSDVTEAQRQQEEIERLAYYDPLTRLPNRRLLSDRIEQALAVAARHATRVAVCYLDLDRFKPINDRFGHEFGDALLIEVARRLEGAVRTHDTVARLGGDEFVLLLTELRSEAESEPILDRVLQLLAERFTLGNGHAVEISASIGIAFFPGDGTNADALLRHADQAMYEAKRAGQNRVQRFPRESEPTH
jgi:diguanylate cyclase (GGDEF)-like protein/PAS domain S-box-containing protein